MILRRLDWSAWKRSPIRGTGGSRKCGQQPAELFSKPPSPNKPAARRAGGRVVRWPPQSTPARKAVLSIHPIGGERKGGIRPKAEVASLGKQTIKSKIGDSPSALRALLFGNYISPKTTGISSFLRSRQTVTVALAPDRVVRSNLSN